MKVGNPKLDNAVSIFNDGQVTFYTDDSAVLEDLKSTGYEVPNAPHSPERPSDKYLHKIAFTCDKLTAHEVLLVRILRAAADFCLTYRRGQLSARRAAGAKH